MVSAGIDLGAKATKAVVLRDGTMVGRAVQPTGFDLGQAAAAVLAEACARAGLQRGDIDRVATTGAGHPDAPGEYRPVSEVSSAVRGAIARCPETRTLIDVGAEAARAIRIDAQGQVVDVAVNDRCAAGAGAFTEAMARALELPLEQLGPLSLESTRTIAMNARCVVFAESEIVAMIHNNVPRPDMARAVNDAIAERIASLARKVGTTPPVALIGGLARNIGFADSLRRALAIDGLAIPEEPELTNALGAALIAADEPSERA